MVEWIGGLLVRGCRFVVDSCCFEWWNLILKFWWDSYVGMECGVGVWFWIVLLVSIYFEWEVRMVDCGEFKFEVSVLGDGYVKGW